VQDTATSGFEDLSKIYLSVAAHDDLSYILCVAIGSCLAVQRRVPTRIHVYTYTYKMGFVIAMMTVGEDG